MLALNLLTSGAFFKALTVLDCGFLKLFKRLKNMLMKSVSLSYFPTPQSIAESSRFQAVIWVKIL